jgi:Tfp pilus assembly protein PilF
MVLMSRNIFCSDCGQPCPPDAKFCHACGRPLQPVSVRVAEASAWTIEIYRHLRDRQGAEAERLVRARLAEYPDDAAAHALLGTSLFTQYKVDEAGEAFQQAIKLGAGNFVVLREYALYLARLGRYADAASEADRALQVAPTRSDYENTRELARLMSQKSQGSFLHQSSFPSLGRFSHVRKP